MRDIFVFEHVGMHQLCLIFFHLFKFSPFFVLLLLLFILTSVGNWGGSHTNIVSDPYVESDYCSFFLSVVCSVS